MRYFFCLFLLCVTFSTLAQQREVIGYYPSWRLYDRDGQVKPVHLKYDRLTTINYAFFAPDENGGHAGTDAWADTILLRGEHDWNNGGYLPNTGLIDLAHQNNVKVFVSIGGWTLSENFPAIAADPAKRQYFASECARVILSYGFDGIDIDWEYPGYSVHGGTEDDKINFTLLLTEIRTQLDALELQLEKELFLTAAVSASPVHAANLELDKIPAILDYLNIMTYDFAGTWDAVSGHNSPLYADESGRQSTANVDAAFKLYHQIYNVPADKLNIGLAFYGRSFDNCSGIGVSHSGPDVITFPEEEGAPMYHQIIGKINQYNLFWDDNALVPYLIGINSASVVSFDNELSVCHKCTYVLDNNARGVLIWEMTGDYLSDYSTPLQDKIFDVFNGSSCEAVTTGKITPEGIKFNVSPNSGRPDDMVLSWDLYINQTARLRISDMTGRIIAEIGVNESGAVSLAGLVPNLSGFYLAEITTGSQKELCRILVH